jgi:beta-N-acetylhexosaminidase
MSSSQDLRRQAGQLLVFGFDGLAVTPALQSALQRLQPGGVILFARNIESPVQTHSLLAEVQHFADERLFLCVDMEGGAVDRLKNVLAPAPSVAAVAASGRRALYREHGRLIGDAVRALGFNVDFAPVADLGAAASRSVMGSRTAGETPASVASYVRGFLLGLKDSSILGCGKHFPGLGEANLDSHLAMPVVGKPWRKLWQEDLAPYRTLHRRMDFVMVAHCAYPEVTGDRTPASLSRQWISEILRRRIGYKGLVVSDDLEMGGVLASATVGEAAVATIRAGSDLYLVCHKAERVEEAYEAVVREAENDPRFRLQVQTAARRILALKRQSPAMLRRAAQRPTPLRVERLRKRLADFAGQLPAAGL